MIALLVMTDGRPEYLTETIASASANLHGPITERWIHDDSGDAEHRVWLRHEFPEFYHINAGCRQGFGGAIRSAWTVLRTLSACRFVFHLEQDFSFNRPVDLHAMADVLDRHPHLVHLALRRQPWNQAERAAGGIVEQHPDEYTDRTDHDNSWLEHSRFFTTNPSLYRISLLDEGWPEGDRSEGRFGIDLLDRHPDWRFGYWGDCDSGEWVHHHGDHRVGTGY